MSHSTCYFVVAEVSLVSLIVVPTHCCFPPRTHLDDPLLHCIISAVQGVSSNTSSGLHLDSSMFLKSKPSCLWQSCEPFPIHTVVYTVVSNALAWCRWPIYTVCSCSELEGAIPGLFGIWFRVRTISAAAYILLL